MFKRSCAVTTLFVLHLAASVLQAQTTRHVDADNCPGPGTGTEADPFCRIQDAIDVAVDGDEIIATPGIYYENINLLGKAINLHSIEGADATTIDASGSGTVVTCDSGEGFDTVISGFTITGGTGTDCAEDPPQTCGGGMLNHGSSPTVTNCTFIGNAVDIFGGGVYNLGSSPTVTNCSFKMNSAWKGGGMANKANSSPIISFCAFIDNNVTGRGGAMHNFDASDPVVTNCGFVGNSAPQGGAIFSRASRPAMSQCDFVGNSATRGGALHLDSSTTISDCTFGDNIASDSGGAVLNRTALTILDSVFLRNEAGHCGGAIANDNAILSSFVNLAFRENVAGFGGAVSNENSSLMSIVNSSFIENSANVGGGIGNEDVLLLSIVNCSFGANTAVQGGAIANYAVASELANCTFSANAADLGGGIANEDSFTVVANSVLWENVTPSAGSGETAQINDSQDSLSFVSYSLIQGLFLYGGNGNINADPLFVNTETNTYSLSPGSPCIDAADNTAVPADATDLDDDGDTNEPVPIDLNGHPRFVDDPDVVDTGNPDGSQAMVDMGASEFQCVDADGDGKLVMCHIPPGNPDRRRSITVRVDAVRAHLAHGDICGACEANAGVVLKAGDDEACPGGLDCDTVLDANSRAPRP